MFQFLYGSIGGLPLQGQCLLYLSFNSYMVRLVVLSLDQDKIQEIGFNSYMVRLVVFAKDQPEYQPLRFNSYMVRLVEIWHIRSVVV